MEIEASAVPKTAPGGAGTGLFATSTIKTGQAVFNLPATFSTVLSTERLADACSNCFANAPYAANVMADVGIKLRFCTGCRVVKYCGKGCQTENWAAIHKHECATYKRLYPKVLPVNSRAALRILKLRSSKQPDVQQDLSMFRSLRSHFKEIAETNMEQYERIMLCAKAEKEYSHSDLDIETIAEYLAKIEVNGFTFTTPFGDPLGLCIQPFACFVNHSCDPNAVVGFDEGNITVRALRTIEPDEQVFISYIDNTNPFEIRQKELAERYFFTCRCSKCLQGDKAREDQFIQASPSSNDIEILKEAGKQAQELLTSAKNARPVFAVKQLKAAIKILHDTKMWPITRQPYPQIRSELIVALLQIESFWPALQHSAVRYLFVDPVLYPQEWHPIRNNHAYILSQLVTVLHHKHSDAMPKDSKYHFDPVSIVYRILAKLNKNLDYELPTVAAMFEADHEDLIAPVREIGYDPSTPSAARAMAPDWEKLGKIAQETLEVDG
ncbi:hypothetical protein MaudMau93_000053 [Microsporum audouinii]